MSDLINKINNLKPEELNALVEAFNNRKPQEKKVFKVNIQGNVIEVSLEKKLEIQSAGEEAFILEDGKIIRKPIVKTPTKATMLIKHKIGGHFCDGDPY